MEQISLIRLKAGDCARVQRIVAGGANATKRLYEMGFNTGARVKVLKNDLGPLIVALEGGNKIALGRGLAEKCLWLNWIRCDGGKDNAEHDCPGGQPQQR